MTFREAADRESGLCYNIGVLNVYLGIDSGSTTSKFVLIDEEEKVIDTFYANNHGDPIKVVKRKV